MYSAVLLKSRVVLAPKAIYTISFFSDGLEYLRLVMRKIIRDIKHDITDQRPNSRNGLWDDII